MGVKYTDARMQRAIRFHDKIENKYIIASPVTETKLGKLGIHFQSPNNVSLFLSISRKQISNARNIYSSLFREVVGKSKSKVAPGKELKIGEKDLTKLYNYFELAQIGVISAYTAVESFANICIPKDFIYTKKTNRGTNESYSKESIERLIATSEKIDLILPKIMGCESPKGSKLWENFKKLESIRNDIIHPKTTIKKSGKQLEEDTSFLGYFLTEDFFSVIESAVDMIKYYCNHSPVNSLYPMGFGDNELETIEMDPNEGHFVKKLDAEDIIEL